MKLHDLKGAYRKSECNCFNHAALWSGEVMCCDIISLTLLQNFDANVVSRQQMYSNMIYSVNVKKNRD